MQDRSRCYCEPIHLWRRWAGSTHLSFTRLTAVVGTTAELHALIMASTVPEQHPVTPTPENVTTKGDGQLALWLTQKPIEPIGIKHGAGAFASGCIQNVHV